MSVSELIKKLNKCDLDAEVEVCVNIINDDTLEIKNVVDNNNKLKIFVIVSA